MAAAAHFLIRKKLFNSKYPQLLVAKDFAVAEKKLHLAVSRRKYDPGKKAPKKRRTSDVKTADPKPLTSQDQPQDESISEQHHKTSPSLNNSHKACPPLNNNYKAKQPLLLNRNLSHHNSVMMMNFQMHLPSPQRLLQRKILDLYQRNQNIVYDQKHSTFNPFYLFLIFSLQIKRKTRYTLEKLTYYHSSAKCAKIVSIYYLPKIMYSLKYISLLFSVPIRRSTNSIFFFQFTFINTFNQLFMF